MDPELPGGLGGFFPGMLADLMKMLRTDAPLQWDLAFQLAHSIAAEDGGDANVEPTERMAIESLLPLAELHVADVTGLVLSPGGRVELAATSPAEWARRTLEAWRTLLDDLARALAPPPASASEAVDSEAGDLGGLLGQWASVLSPAMTAMQVGSIVGHLARRALGTHELPLPRPGASGLLVVPRNLTRFAADWSLPEADVELYFLTEDLARHAVLSRPALADRLARLLVERAASLHLDPNGLEERLGELGPAGLGDMGELARVLGDASAVRALEDTPEVRRIDAELRSITAVVLGYGAVVTATVAERAIGAGVPVREAVRRARVERSDEERGADAMFGLHLDVETADVGETFVRGVLERNGDAELRRLFLDPASLPTPSELVAPGLWLERLHLEAPTA